MISKELLNKVLEIETEDSRGGFQIIGDYLYFGTIGDNSHRINIYKLAHKCKEWAKEKYNIEIYSSLQRNNSPTYWKGPAVATIGNKTWSADTEPEAVFKACEWILNEYKEV